GDFLILVRRRDALVEALVRALKACGVPVAGVDRMKLAEQLAVMDLMALGEALIQPEDDLTLATVLKGPFFAIAEDQLFTLAHGRGSRSLWPMLQAPGGEATDFGAAFARFSRFRALAGRLRPYDLFAHILGPLGGRRAIVGRLGPDALDPMTEFLNRAL